MCCPDGQKQIDNEFALHSVYGAITSYHGRFGACLKHAVQPSFIIVSLVHTWLIRLRRAQSALTEILAMRLLVFLSVLASQHTDEQ